MDDLHSAARHGSPAVGRSDSAIRSLTLGIGRHAALGSLAAAGVRDPPMCACQLGRRSARSGDRKIVMSASGWWTPAWRSVRCPVSRKMSSLTHLVGRQLVPRSDQAGVGIAMINSWAMPVPLPAHTGVPPVLSPVRLCRPPGRL